MVNKINLMSLLKDNLDNKLMGMIFNNKLEKFLIKGIILHNILNINEFIP
jgi:hypothetical protein